MKRNKRNFNSEEPIGSFAASGTYDLVVETGVHAHPCGKRGYPSKVRPYLMVRAEGGLSETLYKVVDFVDLNPKDDVQKQSVKYSSIKQYIQKREITYGFNKSSIYRFYVLKAVYRFIPPFKLPQSQGYRKLFFNDVGIDNPEKILQASFFSSNDLEREQIRKENKLIEKLIEKYKLKGIDRNIVAKSRINQGEFRKLLIRKYKKCCLCGVDDVNLLVASHIKPWVDSNEEERVDDNNGLLLCPNHDKLFDGGYISFDDDGGIIISSEFDESNRHFMFVTDDISINMSPDMSNYMRYHRENRFKS